MCWLEKCFNLRPDQGEGEGDRRAQKKKQFSRRCLWNSEQHKQCELENHVEVKLEPIVAHDRLAGAQAEWRRVIDRKFFSKQ